MNIFILFGGVRCNPDALPGRLNAGTSTAMIAARPDSAAHDGFFRKSVLGAGCGKLSRNFPD